MASPYSPPRLSGGSAGSMGSSLDSFGSTLYYQKLAISKGYKNVGDMWRAEAAKKADYLSQQAAVSLFQNISVHPQDPQFSSPDYAPTGRSLADLTIT